MRRTLKGTVNEEAKHSRAYRFKEYFIAEIEKILSARPKVTRDQRVKIVDAVFAFKNSSLIRLLLQRGKFIMNSKNKELIEIEREIDRLFVQ